jgi:hypothetical protein
MAAVSLQALEPSGIIPSPRGGEPDVDKLRKFPRRFNVWLAGTSRRPSLPLDVENLLNLHMRQTATASRANPASVHRRDNRLGSLAKLTAMRHASSRVSLLVPFCRLASSSKYK